MQRLTRAEFRDAMRKGLGRAVLHARQYGLAGWEEDVVQACLQTAAYDPQCETARAEYLFFFIDLAVDAGVFREPILRALRQAPAEGGHNEYWDLAQLFDLALVFAQRGDAEARQAIYDRFDGNKEGCSLGAEEIVELDGIDGLVHMASVIGSGWKAGLRRLDEVFLLRKLAEHFGREVVLSALITASDSDANVRAFLEVVESSRWLDFGNWDAGPRPEPPRFTLESVLGDVESAAGRYPGRYVTFGRRASQQDIEIVYQRLVEETRPAQMLRYLWVFGRRPLPRLLRKMGLPPGTADRHRRGCQGSRRAGPHGFRHFKAMSRSQADIPTRYG